jgi:hypothetical protein
MKDNKWDNEVMVNSTGEYIYIICHKENQLQSVIDRMTTDSCKLNGYEEWDSDEDMKWILTFQIVEDGNNNLNM